MKIIVDTNVVISGVFFGGAPRRILEAIVQSRVTACATTEIVAEYEDVVEEMISRKQGHLSRNILLPLIQNMNIVPAVSNVKVCRDPDDDKFINCAKDSGSVYIVSGDKDLLVIETFEGIKIVTAAEFCAQYLS
ncbi:MAG: putative toxin-antitoxin system toxin component, PIN family [Bacteroidota bacterium]|jgi:putative PIN family toxin of toxin-antitoxin system|nr:putative toxin-antitoxin system toxin component, PIN family [Bacteroidota bacterium]